MIQVASGVVSSVEYIHQSIMYTVTGPAQDENTWNLHVSNGHLSNRPCSPFHANQVNVKFYPNLNIIVLSKIAKFHTKFSKLQILSMMDRAECHKDKAPSKAIFERCLLTCCWCFLFRLSFSRNSFGFSFFL